MNRLVLWTLPLWGTVTIRAATARDGKHKEGLSTPPVSILKYVTAAVPRGSPPEGRPSPPSSSPPSFFLIFFLSFFLVLCPLSPSPSSFLKTYIYYLFILAVLGPRCCLQAFSSYGEWGLLSSCGAQPSHSGGFSSCRAQALGARSSALAECGLSSCGCLL